MPNQVKSSKSSYGYLSYNNAETGQEGIFAIMVLEPQTHLKSLIFHHEHSYQMADLTEDRKVHFYSLPCKCYSFNKVPMILNNPYL